MSKLSLETKDVLTLLWEGSAYQDNLLLSYRSYHLTIQSILIAVGVGLCVTILTFNDLLRIAISYLLLFIISILAIHLLTVMGKLIRSRGEDVNYFHKRILKNESLFESQDQILTNFKVYQKFVRDKNEEYISEIVVDDKLREVLIEKGKGHTRKVLDSNLFSLFYFIWISFNLISIFWIFYRGVFYKL